MSEGQTKAATSETKQFHMEGLTTAALQMAIWGYNPKASQPPSTLMLTQQK